MVKNPLGLILLLVFSSGCAGPAGVSTSGVVPPAASSSGSLAAKPIDLSAYLGEWEGSWFMWQGVMPVRVKVESISGEWATILYSWGKATGGQWRGGSSRDAWKVLPDGELEFTSPQVSIWLKLVGDGSTAQLKRTEGTWVNTTTLKRALGGTAATLPAVSAAGTPWPDFMSSLEPGKSSSPVTFYLPANTEITPPASDLPATKAAWSGRWSGWACRDQACDTKLAVEKVTNDGASIIYSFASKQGKSVVRLEAKFVGNELQADTGGGARVAYRMRPDGHVDFLWAKGQAWEAGILSKDK